MLQICVVVLVLLVVALFFANTKKVKGAAVSLGGLVIASAWAVHFFKLCTLEGPVLALGISAAAVVVLALLTVYLFLKK